MIKITSSQEFGLLIKQARKSQKMTQTQLASMCGVGARFILDLEKGKTTCVLDKSLKVAQMLGLNITSKNHD